MKLNGFCHIALVFKCFEKIVNSNIISVIQDLLNPYQFAFQSNKGADNAILTAAF